MVNFTQVQYKAKAIIDRNSSIERCNGTMVSYAFPHANYIFKLTRFQRMVLKSFQLINQLEPNSQYFSCAKTSEHPTSISLEKNEEGCGEITA